MPDPIMLWSGPFTVNAGNTTGTQSLASAVALDDGTFLIAWVDDTNNVDDRIGSDIIAQRYHALGTPLGNPFRLNHFGMDAHETDPSLAALSGGGFVLAYEQNTNLGDTDILFEVYDSDLDRIDEGPVAFGAAGGDQVRNPVALTYPGTDGYSIVFERTSVGDTDIVAITGDEGFLGEFDAAQNSADFDRRPDSTAFAGGEFATVYEEDDAGTTSIEFHIRNASSVFISQGTAAATGEDPAVATLVGDINFVITWTRSGGGILAEIRDRDGDLVRNNFTIADNAGDSEGSSDVIGLRDGGFFVVWYDSNDDRLEGRRFDNNGDAVGSVIIIENGASLVRPGLTLLEDGRVLVTWEDGGDIRAAIVDPRDSPIAGDGLDNVLTSRPDGANILGHGGNDFLYGGAGDDFMIGGTGGDFMDGNGGIDWVSYVNSVAGVVADLAAGTGAGGEATGDVLIEIENIAGTAFNDTLTGNNAANELDGFGGDDTIRGAQGADELDGGAGAFDTVSYTGSNAAVTVDLAAGSAAGGHAQGDTIAGFENITGSSNADTLTGDGQANNLDGGGGADTLNGGDGDDRLAGSGGNDRIVGGQGIDMLAGGSGQDTFVLMADTNHRDIVADFSPVNDTLEISAAAFGGGLALGPLAASRFISNETGLAGDANDRFIFNTLNGELYFDSNGIYAGQSRLIATFTPTLPVLTAADFMVV
jgi:Ca2+-binding RTX toxin-like protein